MDKQRTFLSTLQSGAFVLLLLLLSACISLPDVKAPVPSAEDSSGQVRNFDEQTPEHILHAAEIVLREHLPDAEFVRERESLTVNYQLTGFALIFAQNVEKWVVLARQVNSSTIASVVASGEGYSPFENHEWPRERRFLMEETRVDYSMFWSRVNSVLESTPWPECQKRHNFIHKEKGEVLYRAYEPLCRRYKIIFSDHKH